MADLYELIERVQVTLASSRIPGKEELRELHKELDDEIREANRRLRECDALLANGHRPEAIQLAEQEPPLLDVVSILDFAELPEWNDFVAELGLTVTPNLQIDIAADLNRGYSQDAPLDRHLRRFRLYSLARAPLRMRIAMIRRIARLDADNPIWQTDQQSYEEVRLRQIKDEFRDARKNNDIEKLHELATELRGKWLVQPNPRLNERVNESIKSLNSFYALEELRLVAGDLRVARADENLEWARELSDKWNSLASACTDDSDEFRELRTTSLHTLNWVQQQRQLQTAEDAFSKKIDRLQRAIDNGRDDVELHRRYLAATRNSDFEIPLEIQQGYENALQNLDRRPRMRLIIAAACIAALIVLIGIAIWIVRPPKGQAEASKAMPGASARMGSDSVSGKGASQPPERRTISTE